MERTLELADPYNVSDPQAPPGVPPYPRVLDAKAQPNLYRVLRCFNKTKTRPPGRRVKREINGFSGAKVSNIKTNKQRMRKGQIWASVKTNYTGDWFKL